MSDMEFNTTCIKNIDSKQTAELASSEKTPILIRGAKASLRAFEYPIFDLKACLKF